MASFEDAEAFFGSEEYGNAMRGDGFPFPRDAIWRGADGVVDR